MTLFAFTLILATVVSMALIPLLARLARPLRLVDVPDERKVHNGSVPRIGGIAMVVGAVIPILVWVPLREDIRGFLLGTGVLLVFGLLDDRYDLDYRLKFLGQFLAAMVVIVLGGVIIERLPFTVDYTLSHAVGIPLTVLVLIGIINAINLSDGLDGLAGGTTLLTVGTVTLLAYLADDHVLALTGLALGGAILGFLRYNSYPAQIFMGDTGSQFLGFSAVVLTLILTEHSNPALSPVVPLLLLGLPILDTLAVMTQRMAEGRSPFKADKNHIHHKLMALGFDHYEAVLLVYAVQVPLMASAYLLCYESDFLLVGVYLLFCVLMLTLFHMAFTKGWRLHRASENEFLLQRIINHLRHTQWLSKGPWHLIKIVVPVLFVGIALTTNDVSRDIGFASIVMFSLVLVILLWNRGPFDLLERLAIYVTAAFVGYLVEVSPASVDHYRFVEALLFLILAVAVALWVRFSGRGRFETSPLDFLVILFAVLFANLPDWAFQNDAMGDVAVKLIIFFYAIEVLLSGTTPLRNVLSYGTLGTLLILGVRGLVG